MRAQRKDISLIIVICGLYNEIIAYNNKGTLFFPNTICMALTITYESRKLIDTVQNIADKS